MILKFEDLNNKQKKSFENVLGEHYKVYHISEVLPDYLYTCFRALTADVPNMNWDQFDTEELERYDDYLKMKVYETFNGKSVFTNHQSNKVENSIGVIFDTNFNKTNPDDKFVEIIFGIDKEKASDIARGVETGRLKAGSMGCQISHSICSACGKKVFTEIDFCKCLKANKGQMINNVRVAERLRGVAFQEYSIVTVGADPRAKLMYIVSSIIDYKRLPKAASTSDIYELMKIITQEARNASTSEKIRISENLDKIISDLESKDLVLISNNVKFISLDDEINNKLGRLFTYIKNKESVDIAGPVVRRSGIMLNDLVGKKVDVDSKGNVFLV